MVGDRSGPGSAGASDRDQPGASGRVIKLGEQPTASPQHRPESVDESHSAAARSLAGSRERVVATLVAIDGELEGEVFALRDGENQLGRSPASDIVLASPWISRVHARVLCKNDSIRIFPVSEKRTEVNGRPTDGADLEDGDTIVLGRTTLRLRVVD